MPLNRRLLLVGLICLGSMATSAFAAGVFMPRTPALSPDGQTVVFSFQGDLWSVSSDGGQARRLTAHEAYDHSPIFSPDGQTLAFASDRFGDDDIYLMPLTGGAPTRLTFASSHEAPGAFSPDGETLYFATRRLFEFPLGNQIHAIPTSGGTPYRVVDIFGDEVSTHDGETFIIAQGRVKPHRMHYRGSYQREIYSWREGSDPIALTNNRGYDMNPMAAPDGRVFYIGDQNEQIVANIFVMNADGSGIRPVTNFQQDGVRAAGLGDGGRTLVLERGTGLMLVDTAGGQARELKIQVADDMLDNPIVIDNKSAGANELAVTSDGDELAMIIDGDIVFAHKEHGGRATVAVPGPWREQSISFRSGPDTLLFITDRWGEDEICLLVSDDDKESNLRKARHHRIERLTDGAVPCFDPVFSPDGEKILYTRGYADLHVMNVDGSDDKRLLDHWSISGYSWSPDNNWIAYSASDGDFNSDVFIMPAEGGESINITKHPDYDDNPVWSADGSMLAWNTSRHQASPAARDLDIYFLYLTRELDERTEEEWKLWEKTRDDQPGQKDQKDKKEEKDGPHDVTEMAKDEDAEEPEFRIAIDFEDIHLRARRLTRMPGAERPVAIHPQGDKIYFTGGEGESGDLFSIDRFGDERENVTENGTDPSAIIMDADGKNFNFLMNGKPARVPADGGKVQTTDFDARIVTDLPALRFQVLDEGWRTLRDQFYDPGMHGLDWPALRQKYGAWAQKVGHDRDFAAVVNFMLGEVNASHMGYYPHWEKVGQFGTDGWLGLEFATTDRPEKGLKIAEVLAHGPSDMAKARLRPGDILLTVDGKPVGPQNNLYAALETRADLPTWVTVERDGKEMEWELVPASFGKIRGLNYAAMEKKRRARTEELSGGRVGYVHIQGMGYRNVQRFEQNLFAAADGKEALIIDVRNNGGGWTTDLLLTILTQPVHAYTVARNGPIGYPQTERQPFYRWSKPIAVLCNEGSYSNAEIFSHAIKTIGRGPVIGMETGGNVISTGGFGNRYNGYIRLPFRGWYVWGDEKNPERNNKNQEGVHGLTGFLPDYKVELTPADVLHDRDPQLQKAVGLMLEAADEEAGKPQRGVLNQRGESK